MVRTWHMGLNRGAWYDGQPSKRIVTVSIRDGALLLTGRAQWRLVLGRREIRSSELARVNRVRTADRCFAGVLLVDATGSEALLWCDPRESDELVGELSGLGYPVSDEVYQPPSRATRTFLGL